MTKKRFEVPTSDEFDWYHLQGKDVTHINHCFETTTRVMLEEPFQTLSTERAHSQPLPFQQKAAVNYKTTNKFSKHDNRNIFDNDTDFFAFMNGKRCSGRKQFTRENSLNYTGNKLVFSTNAGSDVTPTSTYSASFQSLGNPSKTVSYRRFPKEYADPKPGISKLKTATTTWFNSSDKHKDSTELLVNSIPICTKRNPWKFSYRRSTNVYPI